LRHAASLARSIALWRTTAALAAVALCSLLFLAGPGSIQVIRPMPSVAPARLPAWARPCVIDTGSLQGAVQLAYCARVQGRVIADMGRGGDGERHVLVTGAFHVTLVELHRGMRVPAWGSRITAVGPLQRASYGVRELIALALDG
jgi:hypothetical protein